ncbi:uncharacterized protein LOC141585829 [Silene latifolia]|uniref:uncharacterized protein LOC141585829 n=1 Tax=Silene latifolia TaxID=37657 RepID=UPI003D77DDEC
MSHFSAYSIFSNKAQGRIWLFFIPSTVTINKVSFHEQLIHCDVWFKASNQSIFVTVVYGLNDPRARMGLWEELSSISATITQAWVVLGDFNVVRKLSERVGPNPPSTQDILDFNACLAHCYLDDMHSLGSEFTWLNKQDTGSKTWARLPTSGISDHSPLLVTVAPAGSIKRRFSFLNIWQEHSDYKRLVATAWQVPCYGSPMYQLFHKLKSLRSSLQIPHKESFSNITGKVQAAKKQLEACQSALQADLFSPQLIDLERKLLAQYADLNKQEMDMLFQRAKVHNIRKGEFFSSKIALRKHHSTIGMITDKDGNVRHGLDNVNSAFVEYYTGLLGGEVQVKPLSDIVLSDGPKGEIKKALFSISSNKSPGQDGFSSGFFKGAWDIVGDAFCLAIEEYFRKGRMMRKVNTTLIALVPKKEVPLTVQDFRPIACCSVVYKTISNIIANRLQTVLPDLVGNEQAAFIKERSIFENITMSQNLIKGYNQSLISPRCLIKGDIRKAFDSLQWEFIRQMLNGLGFPSQFVKWTMGCITSPWFSLKINGTLCGFFPGKSGVRQGDPLSPYIFVLSIEILSRQLRRLYLLPQVSSHPKCAKLCLNHLVFADDLMIFMRGDVPSVVDVAQCLDEFASVSGLHANPAKTSIYYGGVAEDVRKQIGVLTGYSEEQFPFRYLGVTLNPDRLAPGMFKVMIDKIQSSIHHWTGNLPSYAGKLQLINSVFVWLGKLLCKPHHAESWRAILKVRDSLLGLVGDQVAVQAVLHSCVLKGRFVISKVYDKRRPKRSKLGWARVLSYPEIRPKHKICLIQAAQQVLSTVDKISARGYHLADVALAWLDWIMVGSGLEELVITSATSTWDAYLEMCFGL